MNIIRYNLLMAEQYTSNEPYIMISITNPTYIAHLKEDPNRKGLLRIQCDDVDDNNTGYRAMDSYQADQIAEFILRFKDQINEIVIHCNAGISRSAGVHKAIYDGFNESYDPRMFALYNRRCYRLVYEAIMCHK